MDEPIFIYTPNRLFTSRSAGLILSRVPLWAWLLLIAAPLRFLNLGQESLWYDESTTVWIVKLPWPSMMTALHGDVHPPLWFWIEWINVRLFGDSEFAVRLPAALLGCFAVWLVWRLALSMGMARRTAFVAGILAAVMPGLLYYSQDARMYPLLVCAVLVAALAALNDAWPVFAVAGIVAVYTHNLGWVYIGLIFVASMAFRPRKWVGGFRGPIYAWIAIGLVYLPWAPTLWYQVTQVGAGYWVQPLSYQRAIFPYMTMIAGWRLADIFQIHVYGAVLAMSLIALIVYREALAFGRRLVILAVILAPIAIAAISWLWRPIYIDRAMLPAAVALMPLWAYALCNLSQPNRRIARLVIVPVLAVGILAHYFPVAPRSDSRQFIGAIKSGWQSDDVVYYLQIGAAGSLTYYLPGFAYATLPEVTNLSQSFSVETRNAMGFHDVKYTDLARQGYRRMWLICSVNPVISQQELDACKGIRAMYPNRLITADLAEANNLSYLYLVELKPWIF